MKKGKIHIETGNYRSVFNQLKRNKNAYNYHSPFQEYSLYKFYKSQDNCEVFAFSGYYKEQLIASVTGVIFFENGLKKHLTKRAIVYGGPILHNSSKHVNVVLDELLKEMKKQLMRKAIYLEFRNLFDYCLNTNIFLTNGFKYKPYVNYRLDISNLEDVMARMSSEKRRQIKKADKHGAYTCVADSPNQIEQFYAILKNLYINKVKKPIPPFKFFLNLYFNFRKYNNGAFILVCFQNKVIGGIICVYNNDTVFEWYCCGLDQDFKNCYPSVMSVYGAVKEGVSKGCVAFDFMGAGMLHKPYGVRQFKSRFGGEMVEYGRYLLVLNPIRYAFGRVALKLKSQFT